MNKKSSKQKSSDAAKILANPSSSEIQKSLAASVLAQSRTNKETSEEMEKIASDVLRSDKYSETTKSLAWSVLSQSN